ncbi:hypothetical protein BH18THE2_BH18THE2_37210 [soil metagenome]
MQLSKTDPWWRSGPTLVNAYSRIKGFAEINHEAKQKENAYQIDSLEIEKELRIVEQYTDPSCHILCRECGQNYGLKPNFEGIETSIDVVNELFRQSTGSSRKLKTHTSSKKTHYKTPEYKL